MKKLFIILFCIFIFIGCSNIEKSIRKSFPMDKMKYVNIRYDADKPKAWSLDSCLKEEFEGLCFCAEGEDLIQLIKDWHVYLGM